MRNAAINKRKKTFFLSAELIKSGGEYFYAKGRNHRKNDGVNHEPLF